MHAFFSKKSKLHVRRPVALTLNTLNLLGPAMLLTALVLLAMAGFGHWSPEEHRWLFSCAGILIALALLIRILWGGAILYLQRTKRDQDQKSAP